MVIAEWVEKSSGERRPRGRVSHIGLLWRRQRIGCMELAMSVDVVIEDSRWEAAGLSAQAGRGVAATLVHLGLDPDAWDVVVMGCDDTRIADLNADFRNLRQPTNVLSWPSEERGAACAGETPSAPSGDPELGDIALSYDTCRREAEAGGKPLADHALHLVVHGTLHLLGYDHVRGSDGDLMEAVETAILGKLGVPDPYDGRGALGAVDDGKD
jgi:probable rRNA maturation factor